MTTRVNGPINAMRLEKNGKVIYLFMDFHWDLYKQSQCEILRSIDFKDFLINNFDSIKDKKIDFFFEKNPIIYKEGFNPAKERYITEISKLFEKSINYDKEKGKMLPSKEFPNVRFHYADFRLTFIMHEIVNLLGNIQAEFIDNFFITDTIDGLTILGNNLKFLFNILQDISPNNSKFKFIKEFEELQQYKKEDTEERLKKIISKIFYDISDSKVKKSINDFLKTVTFSYFNKAFELITNTQKMLTDYRKDNTPWYVKKVHKDIADYGMPYEVHERFRTKVKINLNYLYGYVLNISAFLMDCYLLRRVLDKDYVKTAVIYTGVAHSVNYVYFLLKYFDFDITHYSYLEKDVKKIINKIKSPRELDQYIFPKIMVQCSNLDKFPKSFE